MSDSTPSHSVKPDKYDPETLAAAARKAALSRPDNPKVASLIGQIAASVRVAKEKSEELERTMMDYGPVLPSHGEDGLTYDEFLCDLFGWQWSFGVIESTLQTHFEEEAKEGYRNAGFDDNEEDDGEEEEETADTPHVAELPAAKGRPYWLASEEVRP